MIRTRVLQWVDGNLIYRKWYYAHKIGTYASQLDLVERTHQTLIGMVKTTMHQSESPKPFRIHAIENAVYIRNRVYCKGYSVHALRMYVWCKV